MSAKCQRYHIEFKENFPDAKPCLTPAQAKRVTYKGKRIAFMERILTASERAANEAHHAKVQRRKRRMANAKLGGGTALVIGLGVLLVWWGAKK